MGWRPEDGVPTLLEVLTGGRTGRIAGGFKDNFMASSQPALLPSGADPQALGADPHWNAPQS